MVKNLWTWWITQDKSSEWSGQVRFKPGSLEYK